MTLTEIYEDFFRREGWPKVTDRPSDRGGLTRGGITFTHFNRWRVKHGERPLAVEEFKILGQDAATAFLQDEFVRPLQFVTDEPIFLLLIDLAMNAGVDDAATLLQHELAARGTYFGAIDGIPGPKTRHAWGLFAGEATAADLRGLYRDLLARLIKFTVRNALDAKARAFMASTPDTQLHNLEGWINRRLEFL